MATSSSLKGKYHNDLDFVPGCSGKVPYSTERMANDIVRKFSIHTKGKPKPYLCPNTKLLGKHYHITTQGREGVYKGAG